jgi:hypothetical protein
MSSPIHDAEDLDAALMYAPPWVRGLARDLARDQAQSAPIGPEAPALQSPERRRIGTPGHAFTGDLAMAKVQRQLALHPDSVPEPPFADANSLWPLAVRTGALAAAAAVIAWLLVAMPGTKLLRNEAKPVPPAAAAVSPAAAATVVTSNTQDAAPAATALLVRQGLAGANTQPPTAISLEAPQFMPSAAATPQAAASPPAGSPVAPDGAKTLALDSDEIGTLVKRGQELLTTGDLASARLLLRRAAEAGSAEAALALGATYDPLVIRRLGAIGAAPDTTQARQWYQKAAALGSEAAAQQLANLAQPRQ